MYVFYIHIYIYKLAIPGQKAGQNWLKFFEEACGYPVGYIGYTIFYFCCQKSNFKIPRATAGTSAS